MFERAAKLFGGRGGFCYSGSQFFRRRPNAFGGLLLLGPRTIPCALLSTRDLIPVRSNAVSWGRADVAAGLLVKADVFINAIGFLGIESLNSGGLPLLGRTGYS